MKKKDTGRVYDEIILDNSQITALCVIQGCEAIPFIKKPGQVAFRIRGDVQSALAALYENRSLPIQDYLKALSSVRTAIFTLKKLDHDGKHL